MKTIIEALIFCLVFLLFYGLEMAMIFEQHIINNRGYNEKM